MPKTPEQLFAYFNDLGIEVETVSHEPVFTVEQSQALRGTIPGGHSKNLFLKDKKSNYFLVVACEYAQIDLKTLHKVIDARSRLSFGNADRLMEYLGVTPGSVTPFSLINDTENTVSVILDENLFKFDRLNFHPLVNSMSTTIDAGDLPKFVQATGHDPQILKVSS